MKTCDSLGISKFSNLVNNWKWIQEITTSSQLAYRDLINYSTSPDVKGLCEYIALNLLINYLQVFGKHNLYSSSDIKKHFYKLNYNGEIHNSWGSGNKEAIPYLMYKKTLDKYGGRWHDIREGKSIRKIMKTWLGDYSENLIDDYSVSWSHTSNPEDWIKNYKQPVLFSYFMNGEAHSVVIYGYSSTTNEYVVNYGWPDYDYSRQIVKKSKLWYYFSKGFWYGLRDK
ncbi:putative cysteine peptidase [Spiroplasma endosymbiont of Cantharis rufa]|uniref:putative cysteine peptidase n=1 Tax=Spiroplasma endosymbiont of Cantharis rufa TaxID=3066279 RepID=UPI0030D2AA50